MKPLKQITKKFLSISILSSLVCTGVAQAKINVVTSTEDLASIATEVGGSMVHVKTIVKGYQDVHMIQARPSFMLLVNRADLLIYQGLQLEVGWLPMVVQNARNKKIWPGQLGLLDVSRVINPINVPRGGEVDRSMGDIHPRGNPHYHLNPNNGLLMADIIADRLSQIDPDHADDYKSNLKNFRERLTAKIKEWKGKIEKYQNAKIVVYHQNWNYLLDFFEIESMGAVENRPGVPPSGRHLSQLANLMKRANTKIILQAPYYENEYSDLLAEKTQATVIVLPVSVGGVEEVQSYFSLFDFLVEKLGNAFEKNQPLSKNKTH
jgi:zinc/manganese transport system substrate-binding protein